MSNFREVNDDILKEWFEFRDESLGRFTSEEDQKHSINFEDIAKNILRNVPEQNKKYVKKEVEALYNVTVVEVNTMRYAGKNKSRYTRSGIINGRTNAFKKAIVTLKEGDTIDFYSNI